MSNEEVDLLAGDDVATKDVSNTPVVVIEDDAPDETSQERQDAFDGGVFEWHGNMLEPYSSSRDGLFMRLRKLMGAPALIDAFKDTNLFVGDAHAILFLCSHSAEELAPLMGQPAKLVEEVMLWADKNVAHREAADAALLAFKIFNDSRVNQSEAVPGGVSTSSELGN